jgi:hypothetical protein
MYAFLALLISPALCLADSALQDFWNGGPGTPGPVSYWSNVFDSSSEMDYSFAPSIQLMIEYTFHWIHKSGPGGDEMEVVDTDGDGDLDVVSCQMAFDRISHWENLDGSGLNWARTIIADSLDYPISLDAADIDTDGDVDFAIGTTEGPFWLESTGSVWLKHQIGASHSDCVAIGDLNGDGRIDLASAAEDPYSQVYWYENTGSPVSWIDHLITSDFEDVIRIKMVDVDGDGDADLLVSQDWGPQLGWIENLDGAGENWADHVVCDYLGEMYVHAYGLEAIDMDADGDLDIVAAGNNGLPYGVAIWVENVNGLGTSWLKHPIDSSLDGVCSASAADMDGDGDVDVLVCSGYDWGEDLVAWYENTNGEATAWNRHELDDTVIDARDVAIEDMDMDGDQDAVLCDQMAGVRWYEFSRATTGWLESSILDPPGGSQLQWTDLNWDATVPPGTILTFQVRASDDPADMGAWSPAFAVPGSIAPYLPDPKWYFQYRVNMVTGVPPVSPVLDKVLVQYNSVGIGGEPDNNEPSLTMLSGNPSPGTAIMDVYLPEAGQIDLRIYDIAGRLVSKPVDGEIEAGHHELAVSDLPSGCYCVLLRTPTESIRSMLVVLR